MKNPKEQNPSYPRKHKDPVMLGVSMERALKEAVMKRAKRDNAKGKAAPYIVSLIEADLKTDAKMGLVQAGKDAHDFIIYGKGNAMDVIENLRVNLPAY